MKRVNRILYFVVMFTFLFVPTFASASVICYGHNYILTSSGEYTPIDNTSATGHQVDYYANWICTKCGDMKFDKANDPLFPSKSTPHNYSISTNHRVTLTNTHAYDLKCNINNCTYSEPVECAPMTLLTDHGHTMEGKHRYTYICSSCTCTLTIERHCTPNCPVHIYKLKPSTETE